MNCKRKTFYRSEGVVRLTRWIKKTESIFEINYYTGEKNIKFVACTFADAAESWWNGHLNDEYCPREEMQQVEEELWNLNISDVEISTLCPNFMYPEYSTTSLPFAQTL